MDLSVPAGAALPPRTESGCRDPREERSSRWEGVFSGRRNKNQLFQAFRMGMGVFNTDRAAKGMPDQNEFFGQVEHRSDAIDVVI